VIIRDQAGFHLRDGDGRLPANVRITDLPPYSPEPNQTLRPKSNSPKLILFWYESSINPAGAWSCFDT
jgi:hypothetical protein